MLIFRPLILVQAMHTLLRIKGLISHLRICKPSNKLKSSKCNVIILRPLILAQVILCIIGLISHLKSHSNNYGKHYTLINNNTWILLGIDNMWDRRKNTRKSTNLLIPFSTTHRLVFPPNGLYFWRRVGIELPNICAQYERKRDRSRVSSKGRKGQRVTL